MLQIRKKPIILDSDEFKQLEEEYITLRSFSRIVNRSDVWIKRRFMNNYDPFGYVEDCLKIDIFAPIVNDEGKSVFARKNVYIYLKRDMVKNYFLNSNIYKPELNKIKLCDYEYNGEKAFISDFKIENLIPRSNNSKKGGIKWTTAVKNNYLVIFLADGGVFFYK